MFQNLTQKILIQQAGLKEKQEVKLLLRVLQDYLHKQEPKMLAKGRDVFDSYYNYCLKEIKQGKGKMFLAKINGRAVGLIVGWFAKKAYEGKNKVFYISDLVVVPRHRSRGLGTLLLKTMQQYAQEKGANFLKIDVLYKNPKAADLYRKSGYRDYALTLIKPLA